MLIVNLALLVLVTLIKPEPAISTSSLVPSVPVSLSVVVAAGTEKSYFVSSSAPVVRSTQLPLYNLNLFVLVLK